MTDAHCHLVRGESRHLICEPRTGEVGADDIVFYGTHPWYLDGYNEAALRARLEANPSAGVGEIGLDRLKDRNISPRMREIFESQLKLAAEFQRPVVLHGAKCWGEVVHAVQRIIKQSNNQTNQTISRPPACLFHGFSRSGGLLPDIVALNGFISVGPAVLNDHAVNYRKLVQEIPLERLLVESDATAETTAEIPSVKDIAAKLAELRGFSPSALEEILEKNLENFLAPGLTH